MMMKKYIIIAVIAVLVVLLISYQHHTVNGLRDKVARVQSNIESLLEENASLVHLVVEKEEVTGKIKRQRDSLAKELQIRPKVITKYIDRVIYQRDTMIVEVPVRQVNDTTYLITDKGDCFLWEGMAVLEGRDLEVKRLEFEYKNKVVDIFYWQRKLPVIGRKKYFRQVLQECGGSRTLEVDFVKRR